MLRIKSVIQRRNRFHAKCISLECTQFRLGPKVEAFFLLAIQTLMPFTVLNGTLFTADWADDTHLVSHAVQPAELITHAFQNQAQLSTDNPDTT